jgi:general nucleoside transport system permease protein
MTTMQHAARLRRRWPLETLAARAGVAVGLFAFVVALPPFKARAEWVPALVGLLAVAIGVWVLSRGMRRDGWTAIGFGIVGIGLGLLSTKASVGNLNQVVVWSALLSATLVWATPLTFTAIGGMFCERSGVVNIALEGIMLSGAFFGALGADKFGHWWMGLVTAGVAGAGFAAVHAFMSIHLRADQIVSGTAINFLALGVTGYFFIDIYGENGTPGDIPRIPDIDADTRFIGSAVKHLGPVFGHLNVMIWVSFALLIVAHIALFRTPIGLRIRSVGEHPRAADTVGISVYGTRYAAVILSGVLGALGGAYLSIGYLGSFSENMTAGRGFIALAAVIFGNWRPFGAFAAALLFGASTALSFRLAQPWGNASVLFQALPYVLTLIAVCGVIGRPVPPASAGRPYVKQ